MPTSDSDHTFVMPQELMDLADYLPESGRELASALAKRQAAALAESPARVARKMLALVEALTDYDDQVASHLLIGLLRIASGSNLLAVEQTALRIAGLAHLNADSLVLSDEGLALIRSLVPGLEVALPDSTAQRADAPPPPQIQIPDDAFPFAHIRFGEKTYEIAETPLEDVLCFRLEGQRNWVVLDHDRSSGWDEIGAEILTRSTDVVTDYITMHTVRLPEPDGPPGLHRLDLDNIRWWVRVTDDKAQFLADPHGSWQDLPDDPIAEPIRNIGIRAARARIANFDDSIRDNAMEWARRMAHAASVSPIMAGAA